MLKVFLTILLLSATVTNAITVDAILDSMEANETPKTSRAEITQRVIQADGRENISKLLSYSFNKSDKSLMEYIEPARIKGMKILMLNEGDDIWFYSPRTARIRKIASHQKNQSVNNSDFSYEDMSAKDTREDYTVKIDGEEDKNGITCWKLSAIPKKPGDVSYSRTVTWVDKVKYIPVEAHFFDESGSLWKKLTIEDVQRVGIYWSAKRITMENMLKGSRTVMEMDKMENDIELDESMFSERYLKK